MSNVQVPQTYAMLHFLSPVAMDIIEYEPWPDNHAWREKLPKNHDRLLVRRRPLDRCNPEWAKWVGSEDDQRPETLYMLVQDSYAMTMNMYALTGIEPTSDSPWKTTRTLFAAFWVFRGFILSRRHKWDWSLLPDEIAALMPDDVYGPDGAE